MHWGIAKLVTATDFDSVIRKFESSCPSHSPCKKIVPLVMRPTGSTAIEQWILVHYYAIIRFKEIACMIGEI